VWWGADGGGCPRAALGSFKVDFGVNCHSSAGGVRGLFCAASMASSNWGSRYDQGLWLRSSSRVLDDAWDALRASAANNSASRGRRLLKLSCLFLSYSN
jgi:hypothetical protein